MMRYAPWAVALVLSSVVVAGPAQAGRNHVNVAVVATFGHSPFFFHPFFAQRFCCRSAFFFSGPVFAPPPPVFYSPPVYYAPPPQYYYPPPAVATPPPPTQQGGSSYRSEDCRQYETTITIDGKPQQLVGTVCKRPDGTWHTAP